jgi:hypothetical protein
MSRPFQVCSSFADAAALSARFSSFRVQDAEYARQTSRYPVLWPVIFAEMRRLETPRLLGHQFVGRRIRR